MRVNHWPTVSVIVPVRNGARHVGACLRCLAAQDYPRDRAKILLVDNASTDDTIDVSRRLGVNPLEEPRLGAGIARNRGLAAATGQIVAFTDSDCEPPPGWLRDLVGCLGGCAAATGWIEPAAGGNRFARARAKLHQGYLSECRRLGTEGRLDRLDTANAGAWRRVLEEVGGFNPEIFPGEDRELGARIADHAGPIAFADDLRVRHRYEGRLLPSIAKARGVGEMWVRMPRIVGADSMERHFPDIIAELARAERAPRSGRYRRRVLVKLWGHLAACIASISFPRCFHHYFQATKLSIHLGVLDSPR